MRRVGRLALRWARGPGRQSGVWAINALVFAALPLLELVRPECSAACTDNWARVLFVPQVLFLPALAASLVFAGSWWAQRGHARVHKRYFESLPDREQVDAPPGHVRPKFLDQDLARRTLRSMAFGGSLAALGLAALTQTTVALRACDPWRFQRETGLRVCQGTVQWADMVVAFEVWMLLALSLLFAFVAFLAARRIQVHQPAAKKPRRRRRTRLSLEEGRPASGARGPRTW